MSRRSLFVRSLACCLLAGGASAQNQTGPNFEVTTLTDRNNTVAKVGDCSLREAIRAAKETGQPAVITFKAGLTGTLTLGSTFGQLEVTQPLTLLGPGARSLTIASGGSHRVFRTSGGPHHFSGLTIEGGKVTVADEGGGGIWNTGTLKLEDCALSGNSVTAPDRYPAKGGAIFTSGNLTLWRCSFSGNTATGAAATTGDYGYDGFGGAIHNADSGVLAAAHCTFSGNTGRGGNGSARKGRACGAIHNAGAMTLTSCTISGNTGTGGGRFDAPSFAIGGVFNEGSCTVRSTVIAGNSVTGFSSHRDVRGPFVSGGYNLIGAVTGNPAGEYPATGFTQATDQTGTDASMKDAKLGTFQSNGGPVNTMLPQSGSPLIDKGKNFAGEWLEQRGYFRVVDDEGIGNAAGGDGSDIGSVEAGSAAPGVITMENGTVRGFLAGDRGRIYRFEYSDNLEAPWTPLSGEVMLADGTGRLMFLDPGPLPEKRFYRAARE